MPPAKLCLHTGVFVFHYKVPFQTVLSVADAVSLASDVISANTSAAPVLLQGGTINPVGDRTKWHMPPAADNKMASATAQTATEAAPAVQVPAQTAAQPAHDLQGELVAMARRAAADVAG
jgi:hypothetical protein